MALLTPTFLCTLDLCSASLHLTTTMAAATAPKTVDDHQQDTPFPAKSPGPSPDATESSGAYHTLLPDRTHVSLKFGRNNSDQKLSRKRERELSIEPSTPRPDIDVRLKDCPTRRIGCSEPIYLSISARTERPRHLKPAVRDDDLQRKTGHSWTPLRRKAPAARDREHHPHTLCPLPHTRSRFGRSAKELRT